jgi:hypothetical protein
LGAQGVPLKKIAEIVGHSGVRLTQNVFRHVYRDAKQDTAEKMDAFLAGKEADAAPQKAPKNGGATSVAAKTPSGGINQSVSY